MSVARDGPRLARSLFRGQLSTRTAHSCGSRFASTEAAKPASTNPNDLQELEQSSSFSTPAPSQGQVGDFAKARAEAGRTEKLPGTRYVARKPQHPTYTVLIIYRYQYHPPKFDRGPLHPIQSPPSSDPIARDFVPGPFNYPRLRHTYETTIAPDILALTYQHHPPGYVAPESSKGELREWDGSSPYHKNRPRRGPRGPGSSRLGLLERDITHNNIPAITGITIQANVPDAPAVNKEYLKVARAIVQAVTGEFPKTTKLKSSVVQWGVKEGDAAGVVVNLDGPAAWEFVDKLITLVLPKIKDWRGIKATTGDDHGNIGFGILPEWMSFFPELEYNYSVSTSHEHCAVLQN